MSQKRSGMKLATTCQVIMNLDFWIVVHPAQFLVLVLSYCLEITSGLLILKTIAVDRHLELAGISINRLCHVLPLSHRVDRPHNCIKIMDLLSIRCNIYVSSPRSFDVWCLCLNHFSSSWLARLLSTSYIMLFVVHFLYRSVCQLPHHKDMALLVCVF